MKKYYIDLRRKEMSYIEQTEGRLIGLGRTSMGTAF
jgi:hypothetical protein